MRIGYIHHVSIIRLGALALLVLCLFQPKVRAQEEVSLVFHTISWGMARGQTARFTIFNPSEPVNTELTRQVTFVEMMLMDARGAVIAQSDEIAIPPGEFFSFDFDRTDFALSGESGGGRLQMLVRLEASATDPYSFTQDPKATGPLATSLELIDNSTGRTTAVWLTVGFFEVTPAPKPQ